MNIPRFNVMHRGRRFGLNEYPYDYTTVVAPPYTTGLLLHNSSECLNLPSSSLVSYLPDVSGNNNNFVPVSSSTLFHPEETNRKPALLMDATAGMRTGLALNSPNPFSMFVVFKANVASAALGRRVIQGFPSQAANNWLVGPYRNEFVVFSGGFISTGAYDTLLHVHTVTQNTSSNAYYIDNVLMGSRVPSSWPGTCSLGSGGAFNGEPAISYVYEILIYNSVLSSGDRTDVYNWLFQRWK
jgi:hypothetical protein